MIVECSECQTRFQLDDARVPASGIRVRCSRCKHAFFLKPPGSSPDDAIHEVAEEAAVSGAVPPPGSTQDLSSPQVDESAAHAAEAEDDDAGDWEFNQDVPTPLEEQSSEVSFDADRLADEAGADDASIDIDGVDDDDLVEDFDADEPAQAFGEGDLNHDDLEVAGALEGAEPVADPVAVDEVPELAEAGSEVAPAPESADRDESAFGSVEEIGDLGVGQAGEVGDATEDAEDWDFFGDAGSPAPSASVESAITAATAALEGTALETPSDAGEPTGLDGLSAPVRRDSVVGPWLRGAGHAIGWAAVLGLFGLGLVQGLRPEWISPVSAPTGLQMAGLRAESIEVHWIDSARLGRLLVVSGDLRGASSETTAAVGPLEVALLGADGQVLDHPAEPVGVPIAEPVLREAGRSTMDARASSAAAQLASMTLGGPAKVRFQAVLSDVPLEARRFDIRVAESAGSALERPTSDPQVGIAQEAETVGEAEGGEDAAARAETPLL